MDNYNYNNNNRLFVWACSNDNLSLAQRLYNKDPNICDYHIDSAFRMACKNGYTFMAQWLLEIKPWIDISYDDEWAFRMTCTNGHLYMAQWLLEIKPTIDISAINEWAFRWACTKGYLYMAQWLLEIKPTINISAMDHNAFRHACQNNHLTVAQWLLEKNNNYSFEIDDSETIICKIKHTKQLPIQSESITINNHNERECSICNVNDIDIQTNCQHNFCKECISNWYENHNTCPYCRTTIRYFTPLHISNDDD